MKVAMGANEICLELVTLTTKFQLFWAKMIGLFSDRNLARIGRCNGIAAKFEGNNSSELLQFLNLTVFVSKKQ
jgi:hypothetical protein